MARLVEPFHPMFVEWKPQAITKDGKRALAAAFVDARHYQHRLDEVAPGWQTEYEFIKPDGSLVKCRLTVCGVTREDVGESDATEDNTATSAIAQSFKRACAAFGLGRYLYFLPQVWSDYDTQSHKIASPPSLPAWGKPGGSGYPLSNTAGVIHPQAKEGASGNAVHTTAHSHQDATEAAAGNGNGGEKSSKKNARGESTGKRSSGRGAEAQAELSAETRTATVEALTQEDAAAVIFTLKPKTRPELSGKTLGELAEIAPDVVVWLAEQYNPTPETQQLKEAARILVEAG
jgi:hypothetical protein